MSCTVCGCAESETYFIGSVYRVPFNLLASVLYTQFSGSHWLIAWASHPALQSVSRFDPRAELRVDARILRLVQPSPSEKRSENIRAPEPVWANLCVGVFTSGHGSRGFAVCMDINDLQCKLRVRRASRNFRKGTFRRRWTSKKEKKKLRAKKKKVFVNFSRIRTRVRKC